MGPHILDLFYWFFGERIANKHQASLYSFFLSEGDSYANWHSGRNDCDNINVEDSCFAHAIYDDMSLSMNLAWASQIENDYVHIKVYGKDASLNITTSLGFSINGLYKETTIDIIEINNKQRLTLPIEDRKEPFRRMIHKIVNGNVSPDTNRTKLNGLGLPITIMQDIFSFYSESTFIGKQ